MTTFHFQAATLDDQERAGTIEAQTASEAEHLLLDRGLYPVALTADTWNWGTVLNRRLGQSLSTTDVAQILVDLGHLLGAGVELAVALNTLVATPAKPRTRDVLQHLLGEVRMGRALSVAMATANAGFPPRATAVIRAGEASGALGETLMQAGNDLRQATILRSKVRTALIYPACVAIAVACAILVLVGVVVPALETIFADGLQRLPWQTRMLITGGRFLRGHAIAITAALIGAAATCWWLLRYDNVRIAFEKALLRLPLIGPLLATAETARIATSLALLASSGLPLVKSIAIARDSARLTTTRDAFDVATVRLREGARLHEALAGVTVLGARVLALIRIGEATGRLNPLLTEAARDAEQRVSSSIDRLLALLTPVMTLLFGSIAGFVLYAVMTAILSVNELATVTR